MVANSQKIPFFRINYFGEQSGRRTKIADKRLAFMLFLPLISSVRKLKRYSINIRILLSSVLTLHYLLGFWQDLLFFSWSHQLKNEIQLPEA